ncbi:MarR family winged helix-turn-helix transcriptional regulator [Halalkalibacter krulwichiae]|uniref:HTH marR-type domain-containing protein n=1 Tax=Halalkalibacter krulwichiae TaxID=199441 RepID=A0A1X9MAX2_9BACI|nr:hypothetical protein [Halalkalibacter krulwichiae]ARK29784.1 hypothetical protein BkAM31D_07880 [Halalkalibacter krulwichiae]
MGLDKVKFAKGYEVYALIRSLNFEIEADIRHQLEEHDITFPGFRILWILSFHSIMTMTDLAYLAQANISNVFRQLDKLKEGGLVKIVSGIDARKKEVHLTKKGRLIVQTFIDKHSASSDLRIVELVEKIPKEDLNTFIEVASYMNKALVGEPYYEFVKKSTTDIARS